MNYIKRCKKCILPINYPFIKFNKNDVCNYCTNFKNKKSKENEFLKILDQHRSNKKYDCLVGLSGGRDSVYGLYQLKTKYKMNPLVYTYDWGMNGEISRLNISKICGMLGIEQILRASNSQKIRRLNSLNCKALLSDIQLGMVPVVQALDKKFLSLGKTIAKENDIDLTIHCTGHTYEQREFFLGFAGVNQGLNQNQHMNTYNLINKIKLGLYYLFHTLKNPRYINMSLLENFKAYLITFFHGYDYLRLYEYIEWNEEKIQSTLNDIGFIESQDYGENQWRMGDTQTAFNNYIYYQLAGFTEYDDFRSHQIRNGDLTREEALEFIAKDNLPKINAIKKFCNLVDIDPEFFFKKVEETKLKIK